MRQHFFRLAPALALAFAALLPGIARAADPTFTVSGIHVDATAASAAAAQAIAIDQGRPRAWDILYKRIAKQADWTKEPKLDIAALRGLARGYTVSNEKRSTTRFVADITYIFSPEAVARVLRGVSPGYAITQAKRILVIPMSPTFSVNSTWSETFSSPRFAGSLVPFVVPSGSAPDVVALSHLQFDATNWADVEIVANRIHATEAVLALAVPIPGKVQVWLKRIGVAETPTKASFDVPLVQNNLTQTYPSAADTAVHGIEDMWRQKSPIDFSARNSLIADIRITSPVQWGTIQTAMGMVANVRDVSVVAMDIGLMRVSVSYLGTEDQLHDALAPVGVELTKDGDGWTLAYAPPKPASAAATP
ncbi:MAG TPA: hypothetical protein VMJ73_00680 [Rhizomicrobium sp.]|nr:hypothetical protein [Rhizomicrobium sp.]